MARIEHLAPFEGDSSSIFGRAAYGRDIVRGKSLLQLDAIKQALDRAPWIRDAWSPGSFTDVIAPDGTRYDALTCTIAYHFHKHFGRSYNEEGTPVNQGKTVRDIATMTMQAREYFRSHAHLARTVGDVLKYPNGSIYEMSGKILTFTGD